MPMWNTVLIDYTESRSKLSPFTMQSYMGTWAATSNEHVKKGNKENRMEKESKEKNKIKSPFLLTLLFILSVFAYLCMQGYIWLKSELFHPLAPIRKRGNTGNSRTTSGEIIVNNIRCFIVNRVCFSDNKRKIIRTLRVRVHSQWVSLPRVRLRNSQPIPSYLYFTRLGKSFYADGLGFMDEPRA